MIDQAALTAISSKFTISTVATAPLRPVLTLQAPAETRNPRASADELPFSIPDIDRTVTNVDVPRMKVDFSFLGKWVRAQAVPLPASPSQEQLIGGMPIVEQVALQQGTLTTPLAGVPATIPTPTGSLTSGLSQTLPPPALMESTTTANQGRAGVPALLGQVACTISEVVERVSEVPRSHPVRLAVEWTVTDDLGSGVAVGYVNTTGGTTPLPATPLIFPADGTPASDRGFLALTLVFPPVFSELTSGVPEVLRFTVRARIRLSITPPPPGAPIDTDWVDLPPVPLIVPTIPIPTILVFCENRDFTGRKLVLVPNNSLLGGTGTGAIDIGTALLQITAPALRTLLPAHPLLAFLAGAAISGPGAAAAAFTLISLAPAPNDTIIAARSSVVHLGSFVFDPGGFLSIGRFTGAGMARSLIVIGRPGAVIDMYREQGFSQGSGTRLQVTLDGSLGCAISDLGPNDPTPRIVYPSPFPIPPLPALVTSFSPRWTHNQSIISVALTPASARFI